MSEKNGILLLKAFEGKDRVHIIDFDIKQELQWPSLFQSLASMTNPLSHDRITGIGESKQELNETRDRLAGFAEALNLPFEFHSVVDRLEDVRVWMLDVKEHESVAPFLGEPGQDQSRGDVCTNVACEGNDRLERHESFEKWRKLMK
ncbi:hypothetical protein ACFX13_038765 [Malus domestica]